MSTESQDVTQTLESILQEFDDGRPNQSNAFVMGRQVAVLLALFKYYHYCQGQYVNEEARYLHVLQKAPSNLMKLVAASGVHLDVIRSKTKGPILWERVLNHISAKSTWNGPPRVWPPHLAGEAASGYLQQLSLNDIIFNSILKS